MSGEILTDKEIYPASNSVEIEGYVAEAKLAKISPRFIPLFAHDGNPLGSLSIKGKGIDVKVGHDRDDKLLNIISGIDYSRFFVNLSNNGLQQAHSEIIKKIQRKYNREADWELVAKLCNTVLKPYRN